MPILAYSLKSISKENIPESAWKDPMRSSSGKFPLSVRCVLFSAFRSFPLPSESPVLFHSYDFSLEFVELSGSLSHAFVTSQTIVSGHKTVLNVL